MSIAKLYQFKEISKFDAPPHKRDYIYCEAFTQDNHSPYYSEWRQNRYGQGDRDPRHCRRVAVVRIDGTPYCSAHAGLIALHRWVNGKLVECPTTEGATVDEKDGSM